MATILRPPSEPLPAGGTSGQVLAKATDTDYDVAWVDETGPGGGGLPETPLAVVHGGTGATSAPAALTALGAQGVSQKGQANGYAGLDSGGFVPDAQIPAAIARDTEVTSAVAAEVTARNAAIATAIANLIASAPGALDTLNEIAAALGNDPNFATTITNLLAGKLGISGHDANSIVVSIAGTLADLDIPASTFVGRKATGNVVPMTVAEVITLLGLATVATTGAYNDLTGKPTLGTAAAQNTTAFDAAGAAAAAQAASVPLAGGTMTGELVVPDLKATGKTGATGSPAIIAGGTTGGPPISGAHVVGEAVVDATGIWWVCTVAGTPGTWIDASSSGKEIDYAAVSSAITGTTSTTLADLPNIATITVPTTLTRPVMLEAYLPQVFNNTAGDGVLASITDTSGTEYERGKFISSTASAIGMILLRKRLAVGTGGTFKIQWAAVTGGTANCVLVASPGVGASVPYIRAFTL